jgi:hypothetical protein
VLWGDDRFDDRGQIVDVRESLHAEDHVVERALLGTGGIFGGADDYRPLLAGVTAVWHRVRIVPCRGLKRSLPNEVDLQSW